MVAYMSWPCGHSYQFLGLCNAAHAGHSIHNTNTTSKEVMPPPENWERKRAKIPSLILVQLLILTINLNFSAKN